MRTELSKYPTLRISETHHLSWRKSGKDRTICVLYNPITDFVYAEGSAVRKKPDAFDFVFGMKKSLISLFRNNKFERPFRKLCFDIFYDAYGEGVCKPIERVGKVYRTGEGQYTVQFPMCEEAKKLSESLDKLFAKHYPTPTYIKNQKGIY